VFESDELTERTTTAVEKEIHREEVERADSSKEAYA
jgi:hypothetical protein